MSPVCRRNSGGTCRALIFSTAALKVAATSGLAGLLNPMWLSLICTKLSSPILWDFVFDPMSKASAREVSTPPSITQSAPVPAQAMHFRNPRRSIPSLWWSCSMKPLVFGSDSFVFRIVSSPSAMWCFASGWLRRRKPFSVLSIRPASPARTCYICMNRGRLGFIP